MLLNRDGTRLVNWSVFFPEEKIFDKYDHKVNLYQLYKNFK